MAKETTITFRLTQEQKDQIKKLADEKDWTVSKYVYQVMTKHLQEEKNNG